MTWLPIDDGPEPESADLKYAREWCDKIMAMLGGNTWFVHSETVEPGVCHDCRYTRVRYLYLDLELCWQCATLRSNADPDRPGVTERVDAAIARYGLPQDDEVAA